MSVIILCIVTLSVIMLYVAMGVIMLCVVIWIGIIFGSDMQIVLVLSVVMLVC